MTTNVIQRMGQHKSKFVPGFSAKHSLNRLLWYQTHATIESAARREKAIKRRHRAWKIRLIEQTNPQSRDELPLRGQLATRPGPVTPGEYRAEVPRTSPGPHPRWKDLYSEL